MYSSFRFQGSYDPLSTSVIGNEFPNSICICMCISGSCNELIGIKHNVGIIIQCMYNHEITLANLMVCETVTCCYVCHCNVVIL